jgi:hypothetical protein
MEPNRKRVVLGGAIVVGIILIFLAGYIPGSSRARSAAEESRQSAERLGETEEVLAQRQYDLEVARLRGELGEILHEANINNFANAAEQASSFFDRLGDALKSPHLGPGARREVLETIYARRDEISADLARADPGVKTKLAEMYMQFGAATQ